MRCRWFAAAALAALVLPGAAQAATRPSKLAPPPELIAMMDRGQPNGLDGLRTFANAVQPGIGMMVSDQMIDAGLAKVVGLQSLDAFDHQRAIYLLFADGDGVKQSFAVVGRIADKSKLGNLGALKLANRHGWALVGSAPAVQKLSRWALAALPGLAPSPSPSVTLFVTHARTRYRSQLDQMQSAMKSAPVPGGPQNAQFRQTLTDGFEALIGDTDLLRITLDGDQSQVGLEFAVSARPGSRLAQFFEVQRPSDFALLGRLPSASPTFLTAGQFAAGPYRAAFRDVMAQLVGRGGAPPGLMQFFDGIISSSTGEIATTSNLTKSGTTSAYLYDLTDPAAMETAVNGLITSIGSGRTFDILGMKETLKPVPGALVHDGVAVRGYDQTCDFSKLPAASRATTEKMMGKQPLRTELAVFDHLGLLATGQGAEVRAATIIDAARGKAAHYTPSAEIAALLSTARARKDSGILVVNLAPFAALVDSKVTFNGTLTSTFGVAGGWGRVRLAVSAEAIRSALPRKK